MKLETLPIILISLYCCCGRSDPGLSRIKSLISQGSHKEARDAAKRLLEADPSNLEAKHMLAFSHAAGEAEGGDPALAVRLGLEIVTSEQQDITYLREKTASLALNAALNTDDNELIRECAQVICDHQRDHGDQLSDDIIRDAATQLAEMLLTTGDLGELDSLLTSGLVKRNTLELDLHQYYRCRLKHMTNTVCNEMFESVLEGLKDGNVMEDMRFLMQRVLRSLDKKPELRTEADVLMDISVELGVFPSRGQRCGWVEQGLTSRPVWDLTSLGEAGERLKEVEAVWEELRKEAEVLVHHHDWTQEEAGVWTRGETHLEKEDRWQQLVFSDQPPPPPSVCAAAPRLCSLADQVYRRDQGQPPAAGGIKLSVLSGATRVAPHYGLTNAKLRAHLPLVVPSDPAPVLRVAGRNMTWTEGQLLVFDDSFEHEVIHESQGQRIVLIIDFHHPDLSQERRQWWHDHVKVVGMGVDGPKFDIIKDADHAVNTEHSHKDEL